MRGALVKPEWFGDYRSMTARGIATDVGALLNVALGYSDAASLYALARARTSWQEARTKATVSTSAHAVRLIVAGVVDGPLPYFALDPLLVGETDAALAAHVTRASVAIHPQRIKDRRPEEFEGVDSIVSMLHSGLLACPAGAVSGLLSLGDPRVVSRVRGVLEALPDEGLIVLHAGLEGGLVKAVIELFLDWVDEAHTPTRAELICRSLLDWVTTDPAGGVAVARCRLPDENEPLSVERINSWSQMDYAQIVGARLASLIETKPDVASLGELAERWDLNRPVLAGSSGDPDKPTKRQ